MIAFKNLKRHLSDTSLLFSGRWFRQRSGDEMAEFDAPAIEVSAYRGQRPTDFNAELMVGGENHDLTLRLKLPFMPQLYVHLCNAMPGLRKKANAWAQRQAAANKKANAVARSAGQYGGLPEWTHELDPFESSRVTGVYLFGNRAVASLWRNSWSSQSGANKVAPWRSTGWGWSAFVDDVVYGPAAHTSEVLSETFTTIEMPEHDYPAKVRLSRDTWTRPRGLAPLVVERAYVQVDDGIPLAGKGENSYDCGDDAIYSSRFPARSVAEARLHVAADVMADRMKRSGTVRWNKAAPAAEA